MQTIIRLVMVIALFAVRLPMFLNRAMRRDMRAVTHRGIPGFWMGGRFLPCIAGGAPNFLEGLKFAPTFAPVTDFLAGTKNSDVHNMAGFDGAMFILHWGVGATGTTLITVEACDNVSPSNTAAIVFWYREITSGDTDGAWTKATTAGFTTTAGSNHIIQIFVSASDVAAASVNSTVGNKYVQLDCVEQTASAILGGGLFIGIGGRYQEDVNATTIA